VSRPGVITGLLIVAILDSTACGPVGPSPPPQSHEATPHPTNISVMLDPSHAVTQFVSLAGDTLQTTGTDGTKYSLVIPKNALLYGNNITMTPIASASNLPLSGGLVGGVKLEPEGLHLVRPATLTIDPAKPIPAGLELGFGFHQDGQDFYLKTLWPSGRFVVDLMHFSGVGAGIGSNTDLATQKQRVPHEAEDQLDQHQAIARDDMARLSRQERGGPPEDVTNETSIRAPVDLSSKAIAETEIVFHEFYQVRVAPRLHAAETDEKQLESAGQTFMSWSHDLAVMGYSLDKGQYAKEYGDAEKSLIKGLKNAYEKSARRCEQGDPLGLAQMTHDARWASLLGTGNDAMLKQLQTTGQKCLPKWEVQVTMHGSPAGCKPPANPDETCTTSADLDLVAGVAPHGQAPAVPDLGGGSAAMFTGTVQATLHLRDAYSSPYSASCLSGDDGGAGEWAATFFQAGDTLVIALSSGVVWTLNQCRRQFRVRDGCEIVLVVLATATNSQFLIETHSHDFSSTKPGPGVTCGSSFGDMNERWQIKITGQSPQGSTLPI
jgi:hypothetical protein